MFTTSKPAPTLANNDVTLYNILFMKENFDFFWLLSNDADEQSFELNKVFLKGESLEEFQTSVPCSVCMQRVKQDIKK